MSNLQPTPAGGMVFTDDLAPIEWITNDMVLRFILGGGVEGSAIISLLERNP